MQSAIGILMNLFRGHILGSFICYLMPCIYLSYLEIIIFSLIYLICDTPKPGGPVDHRQPAETRVSHIMRLIHE